MNARWRARLACAMGMAWLGVSAAWATDPFHTRHEVPANAGSALLGEHMACVFGAPTVPLTLPETVERALCANPDTRDAWTIIEEQTAAVGISKAAYLPTLSATGQWVHENSLTNVRDHAPLSSNYSTGVHSGNLTFGWILYDFGERRAALNHAEALLSAAQASADAVLQQTFADAAKAYYAAQAAREQLHADDAIVAAAWSGVTAAEERVGRGVGPITEEYQAQSAYEQARVSQTRDRGQALVAQGNLANAMALSPDTPLTLVPLDDTVQPSEAFQSSVTQLMAQAVSSHPAVAAAANELRAAQVGVTQAKAQGRPTIKLVAQYSQNNNPVQLGLGQPHFPATGHDGYIGVQVNVPIFSGFATTYQVRQAEAQMDQQAVALDKARQHVALQVWTSYQTLQTDTQNLTTSALSQHVATLAWQSAQRRYGSGVGTILELLSTQTALAQARQQRVEALTAWRYDRLALASSLGKLGWGDVNGR
ncbi:TolC family protein [Rhodanobacter sp. AS-Z3]|uniref:TolC family protein n=1 Tax=Rhodanobacter sp. AS-Z3 TaxID=3031330 RepID=UPI00247A5C8A|nr:TolC family protein [Rhodanobacter sp. AS-Z3]WEN13777.1 TolC family protein [Rhodanobacter sp. AS-Z3]